MFLRLLSLVAASSLLFAAASAQLLGYDFTINSSSSGLTGELNFSADTSGTLIGNWDPDANATGTRTKPGLSGSFGETENLPVNAWLTLGLNDDVDTDATGRFRMLVDLDSGVAIVMGFRADYLGGQTLSIPATLTIRYDSFRTRQPSSIFVGGFPIPIPFGSVDVTVMEAAQNQPLAFGTVTPDGLGGYDVAVIVPTALTAEMTFLGNPLSLPGVPFAVPLVGKLAPNGSTATMQSQQPITFGQEIEIGQALPQLPLDIPTILPPGSTAHLLFDLTLDRIVAGFDGSTQMNANGTFVLLGDVNLDGIVDDKDLAMVLEAYALLGGGNPADINLDGVVDDADVTIVLMMFGAEG
ncbi:MAG: hypothetical protein HUU60_05525 [Armatimonadetes bacterium]|nr:hypothetical protein [Armatimonadota bacterium]